MYKVRSAINVHGFSSDVLGNTRARKPNKAQTKRENITGVRLQHFSAYEHVVSNLYFSIYPLFILKQGASSGLNKR